MSAAGFGLPSPRRPTPRPGIGPEDVSLAEVYDLSSALELDWYEDIGLCGEGEAEKLLRDGATTLGGRVPVNPSGGLSCFGEAIPAQAIAQVCECVWQLRARPPGTRSKAPGWPSRPTKVCSATVPRSCSVADTQVAGKFGLRVRIVCQAGRLGYW